MCDKSEIRREIRRRLSAMTDSEKRRKSREICAKVISELERFKPSVCMLYKALPNEVNVDEVIEYCLSAGIIVLLPRVKGEIIEAVPYGEFNTGAYGISEPIGEAVDLTPEVTITPLLGADKRNTRLGKGKGYYDRFFKNVGTYKIGVAFSEQIVDELPRQEYDIPLDTVICD